MAKRNESVSNCKVWGIETDDAELSTYDTSFPTPATAMIMNQSMESRMMENDFKDDTLNAHVTESNSSSQELNFKVKCPKYSVSLPNSNTNGIRSQQLRRMTILSSESNSVSNVNTFEEAFSKNRHAGSFRLKIGRDELASGAHVNRDDALNQSLESHDQIMNTESDAKDTESFLDSDSSDVFIMPEDEHPQAVDQEQATVRLPKGTTDRHKQMRIISSQGNYESSTDTFEEAFSKHRYAGSFRLRFCREPVVHQRVRAQVSNADTTGSEILVLHDDTDIQELPEPATPPCKEMATENSESKVSEIKYEKGATASMSTTDDFIAVQESEIGR